MWWSGGQEQVHVLVEIRPALRTEMSFEAFFGLAADGKTNRRGLPNPVRWAVLAREYGDELHLASPAVPVQRALFGPLVVVGRLLGYRDWYPRYGAEPLPKGPAPTEPGAAPRAEGWSGQPAGRTPSRSVAE